MHIGSHERWYTQHLGDPMNRSRAGYRDRERLLDDFAFALRGRARVRAVRFADAFFFRRVAGFRRVAFFGVFTRSGSWAPPVSRFHSS